MLNPKHSLSHSIFLSDIAIQQTVKTHDKIQLDWYNHIGVDLPVHVRIMPQVSAQIYF